LSQPLWQPKELVETLKPLETRGCIPPIQGIGIDSRRVSKNDLFVALPQDFGPEFYPSTAPKSDGHRYVQHAASSGAGAALVTRFTESRLPQIRVKNTLKGLWSLAAKSRSRMTGKVIAVTGSSGKTTLKEFLRTAFDCYSSKGNLNNFLGLPLSLANMPRDTRMSVFELGMNHQNEIAPLARLARPDIAIVLNVLPVHLEQLGSLDAIRREKLSIAEGLNRKGILLLPDDLNDESVFAGQVIRFGESAHATLRLVSKNNQLCAIRLDGKTIPFKIPNPNRHRQLAAAIALACGLILDEDTGKMTDRLQQQDISIEGRGSLTQIRNVTLIDESYNANPKSMQLALQNLLDQSVKGRRYALLGDMLELGTKACEAHSALAEQCHRLSGVWLVGPLVSRLAELLPKKKILGIAKNVDELPVEQVVRRLRPGDCLMVKGSNRIFWQHNYVRRLAEQLEESELLHESN